MTPITAPAPLPSAAPAADTAADTIADTAAEGGAITELVVCTTCRPDGTPRDQPAPGERLLQQVLQQAATLPDAVQARLRVRGVACLSSCSRACTVALQAAGKHSYVFGDLAPDGLEGREGADAGSVADSPGVTAGQILTCARQHADTPDGLLAWRDRPERLRRGIVVRLPPPDAAGAGPLETT